MKISELTFAAGCGCCQTYDQAEFVAGSAQVTAMRVPQENGTVQYILIVTRQGVAPERHLKLSEDRADELLGEML